MLAICFEKVNNIYAMRKIHAEHLNPTRSFFTLSYFQLGDAPFSAISTTSR